MLALATFLTVFLAGSSVLTASVPNKPYYDLENADNLFKDFVKQYGKEYDPKDYFERLQIFKDTLKDINRRNAKYPKTTFAVNNFADLTREEWKTRVGFKKFNQTSIKVINAKSMYSPPSKLDWRDKGVVSHVKNQGDCYNGHIFSAIGNIEGQYAIKHNQCLALSEGQALDCLYTGKCRGGDPTEVHQVMQELAQGAGVMKEEDYPYVDEIGQCKADVNKIAVRVKDGIQLDIPDEDTLMQKLAEIGPLAVAIASDDLRFYQNGILHPDACTHYETLIDHDMLLVGYGEEKGEKFWILKNSRGKEWGEAGYVRLLRGVNACQMGTSYTATALVD